MQKTKSVSRKKIKITAVSATKIHSKSTSGSKKHFLPQPASKPDSLQDFMNVKKAAKEEFYRGMAEKFDERELKVPLLLIFATELNGGNEQVDRELLFQILEGCSVLPMKVVVIDSEERSDLHETLNKHITWFNPVTDFADKVTGPKEVDRLLLAADMALIFHSHMELIQVLQSYGAVIMAQEGSPLLENYKPNEETGNAFMFSKKDPWSIFATLVRATETYKFIFDWRHIVRSIIK